jgi:hypothetical protein
MATDAAARLVSHTGSDTLVLVGSPRRLRGKLRFLNDTNKSVTVSAAVVAADVPAVTEGTAPSAELEHWSPRVLAPGESSPVTVRVCLDRFTPPGSYPATLVIDGRSQPAELQVVEDVSLSLSPSELIVTGDPDVVQTKSLVITNDGNVPLAVSHVGPVELVPDDRRPSLLERLGVVRPDVIEPDVTIVEDRGDKNDRKDADDKDTDDDKPPPPVVAAVIDPPVLVQPGESRAVECAVTVGGTIDPGLRYRADGALYTTDLRFTVVPPQQAPPLVPAERPRAPRSHKTKAPAKKATARTTQKRRQT